ncbi:MAG TPA: hypothetical protein VJC07_02300 [Candidatus Nanoarchaeia archaeon]|nr:hypothetical protein [Candidatus Nanoarchaeia archaeon]
MKRIIIDTDFLLDCAKWKIDLFSGFEKACDFHYELCILDKTLEELEGKEGSKLAKTYATRLKVIETSMDKPVDELILEMGPCIVATQDKELKEKLKKAHFSLMTIRQKKYFVM